MKILIERERERQKKEGRRVGRESKRNRAEEEKSESE